MQKSLAKNTIYNILYMATNTLFPLITSIYVSRILLPAGVGKVAAAQNLVSYFVTIAALGLPSYGVREVAKVRENKTERNRLFTELWSINFISTTIIAVGFYILMCLNVGTKGDWLLYSVCGLAIIFNYLNIDWAYRGLEEYGFITGRNLTIKVISFISLFFLVRTREHYINYALITSLAGGANYAVNVIHARKFFRLDFKKLRIRRHVMPLAIIACSIFLTNIYNKIDVTMLNYMATDEAVGYYAYAQKIVNIIITVTNAVTAAMLPRLSFYYENDREEFYKLLNVGFEALCLLAFPFTAGLFLLSPQAVELLYGKAFAPAALSIRLMCPLIMIKSFGDLYCYQLSYSTKNEKIVIPAAAAASVINIITNAIFIPVLLQNGAVLASVFSEFVTNAVQFVYMKKKLSIKIKGRALITVCLSTAIMSAGVILLMQIKLQRITCIIFEVLGGTVIYIIANVVLKNEIMLEIICKCKEMVKLYRTH